MNGRVAKVIRAVYPNKSESRAFRKAYTRNPESVRVEVRRTANKIREYRRSGKDVKLFQVNPETHAIEPVKGGEDGNAVVGSKDSTSGASGRKGHNRQESKVGT